LKQKNSTGLQRLGAVFNILSLLCDNMYTPIPITDFAAASDFSHANYRFFSFFFSLILMPPTGQAGRRMHYVLGLSVCPFICYQTCEHDILKKNQT